jgi:hypothetical protein
MCLFHGKAVEHDILGELEVFLNRTIRGMISMDGGHAWEKLRWHQTKPASSMAVEQEGHISL